MSRLAVVPGLAARTAVRQRAEAGKRGLIARYGRLGRPVGGGAPGLMAT